MISTTPASASRHWSEWSPFSNFGHEVYMTLRLPLQKGKLPITIARLWVCFPWRPKIFTSEEVHQTTLELPFFVDSSTLLYWYSWFWHEFTSSQIKHQNMTVAIVFESRKVLHDVQKQTWHMVFSIYSGKLLNNQIWDLCEVAAERIAQPIVVPWLTVMIGVPDVKRASLFFCSEPQPHKVFLCNCM